MPFATSNVQSRNLGGGGREIYGNWSATAGDAAGTLAVAGVLLSPPLFASLDGSGPQQEEVHCSTSLSGAITTITVNHLNTVTTGVFNVKVSGG